MPRLFPSLGRSTKEPGRSGAYGQYDGYDAPHGYYDCGYAEQESRHNRSPWSKMLSRKSTKRKYATDVDQQGVAPVGDRYRTTVVDYPEDQRPVVPGLPTDDSSSFEDFLSARNAADNTIPLVQRESSLTRLQQAFADNGTYAPALSAAPSASHGAPFYAPSPRSGIPGPMGQPHVSAVNDMHQSALLVNSPVPQMQGIRPDIVHHSASYPAHERFHRRHRERERSAPPVPSYRDHPAYWEEPLDPNEEPPVVVVVEHGKHGKKDKYYIIPGGAPVIFEDEDGNELTRVGDFSGRYKPLRRPRPVIVQDQYGREICRAGFGGEDHISVGSDNHSRHHTSGSSRTDPRGRPSHRSYDNRGYATHKPSMHRPSQPMYGPAPDSYIRDPHYQPSRPRAGTHSSREDPDMCRPEPRNERSQRSGRSGSSSDTLVRSSAREHQSPHSHRSHQSSSGRSHDRSRGYGPDDRDRRREDDYYGRDHRSRRHRGSASSGSDSYDDRRSYRERRYRYDDRYDFD